MVSQDSYPPTNMFAAQQHLLVERLHHLLAMLPPILRTDIISSLERNGKLLYQPETDANPLNPTLPAGTWSLLTLLVAQYISPDIDLMYVSNVAVAIECFVCALDLLDDVEDEDQTEIVQALGVARVLNVSTTLLMLAQRAIISLTEQEIPAPLILHLLDTLQASALVATAGQHRDLLAEHRLANDLTREECIEIAAAKAGAIMRLACQLGASCAGADDKLCNQFSELGELLGIAHQLDNDSHDLYYLLQDETPAIIPGERVETRKSVKTDLVRGKKTLPVVLAAKIIAPLGKTLESSEEEHRQYLQALHEGIVTTWGISLLYRERARSCLQEIEAQRPVTPALRFVLGFG